MCKAWICKSPECVVNYTRTLFPSQTPSLFRNALFFKFEGQNPSYLRGAVIARSREHKPGTDMPGMRALAWILLLGPLWQLALENIQFTVQSFGALARNICSSRARCTCPADAAASLGVEPYLSVAPIKKRTCGVERSVVQCSALW